MLPTTRSGRTFFSGAAIAIATLVIAIGVRGKAAPYMPESPAYRQKGEASAPIVISEFSDFQCPACKAAAEPLKKIQSLFPGKVRIVFKHFPWGFHPWAKGAAVASECAGKQGAFWPYHDILFEKQYLWAQRKNADDARGAFMAIAETLGLKEVDFLACLNDPATLAIVDNDLEDAKNHWIGSTPTFFINGRRFVGALQLRTSGLNHIENILKK